MEDIQWVKIAEGSWHIIRETGEDQTGVAYVTTLCGLDRPWDGEWLSERPGNEASCENCLRILTKD